MNMTSDNNDLTRTPRDLREIPWNELDHPITSDDFQVANRALAEAEGISVDELTERFKRILITTDEFELHSDLANMRVWREFLIAQGDTDTWPALTAHDLTFADYVGYARERLETLAQRHMPVGRPTLRESARG